MIESKFSKRYWIFILLLLCFAVFILNELVRVTSGVQFINIDYSKPGNQPIQIVICVSAFLFLLYTLWKNGRKIYIDTVESTISFKRLLCQKKTSSFTDLDGYIEAKQHSKSGSFLVLYLVKGGRCLLIISGAYFSNIDEIKESLQPLTKLGSYSNNFLLDCRVFFGKKMIY